MINPDGVVFGNYRTSFLGKDLNRLFMDAETSGIDPLLIPEVTAVKKMISYCGKNFGGRDKIFAFFNIHQHSKRKSVFLYGP